MKRIIVSVTNDLSGDNRVHRICLTLTRMGFSVMLAGRMLPFSQPLAGRDYATHRMQLLFLKGPLFYAEFNLRLLVFLLFNRVDLLLANDLDTLPANRIAAMLKRKPLVYDSHEYFTEVPELFGRHRVKKCWEWLEKKLVPRVDDAYTVCQSIATIYTGKYGIPFHVVRNLPIAELPSEFHANTHPEGTRKMIIYQGALNRGRGLEQAIRAMKYLPDALLLLAGSGDREKELMQLASELQLHNVSFAGRVPLEKLGLLTRQAWLGISVEEDIGLNYRYALPNKLFDYIQSRIPVVVSDLPEMSRIVKQYNIGIVASSHDPVHLADVFSTALKDISLRKVWRENLEKAASELTWEKEEPEVKRIFSKYLDQETMLPE